MWFRVNSSGNTGLGLSIQGLGLRVYCLDFRVSDLCTEIYGLLFRVEDLDIRVYGLCTVFTSAMMKYRKFMPRVTTT